MVLLLHKFVNLHINIPMTLFHILYTVYSSFIRSHINTKIVFSGCVRHPKGHGGNNDWYRPVGLLLQHGSKWHYIASFICCNIFIFSHIPTNDIKLFMVTQSTVTATYFINLRGENKGTGFRESYDIEKNDILLKFKQLVIRVVDC